MAMICCAVGRKKNDAIPFLGVLQVAQGMGTLLAAGVHHANAHGFVLCDIKPCNPLLGICKGADGTLVVTLKCCDLGAISKEGIPKGHIT
jgi:hypothetical protein